MTKPANDNDPIAELAAFMALPADDPRLIAALKRMEAGKPPERPLSGVVIGHGPSKPDRE
jgi:hypothetical protein